MGEATIGTVDGRGNKVDGRGNKADRRGNKEDVALLKRPWQMSCKFWGVFLFIRNVFNLSGSAIKMKI